MFIYYILKISNKYNYSNFSRVSDMYGNAKPDLRIRADSSLAFDLEQQIVGKNVDRAERHGF